MWYKLGIHEYITFHNTILQEVRGEEGERKEGEQRHKYHRKEENSGVCVGRKERAHWYACSISLGVT